MIWVIINNLFIRHKILIKGHVIDNIRNDIEIMIWKFVDNLYIRNNIGNKIKGYDIDL